MQRLHAGCFALLSLVTTEKKGKCNMNGVLPPRTGLWGKAAIFARGCWQGHEAGAGAGMGRRGLCPRRSEGQATRHGSAGGTGNPTSQRGHSAVPLMPEEMHCRLLLPGTASLLALLL